MPLPLISCLTVSADRLILLKQAIGCYLGQTYPARELVIVTAAGPRYRQAIHDHIAMLGRTDIRLVEVEPENAPLGALRNASLDAARGELVCQWDDDDLYHPDRLDRQYRALIADDAEACFLTDHLQYFERDHALYWIDWRKFSGNREKQMLPGSMLAIRDRRFRYPETGTAAHWGEDNALRGIVASNVKVAVLDDAGDLYVYRCHGRNTMPDSHHHAITGCGGTDVSFIAAREDRLRRVLQHYALPSPCHVKAIGGATVFTHSAATRVHAS